MRHVDEGTLHAWLDRQVADPDEAAWIATHLRECATCSARVADEAATLRDAESLLASVAPSADASREAFDALVAARHSGGAHSGGAQDMTAPRQDAHRAPTPGRWITPVSWAATVALAVGLGWLARQMTSSGETSSPVPITTVAEHRDAPSPVPPAPAAPGPAPSPAPAPARAPAPESAPARAPAASSAELQRQPLPTATPPAVPSADAPPTPEPLAPVVAAFPPPVVYVPPAPQQSPTAPTTENAVDAPPPGPAGLPLAGGVPSGVTAGRSGGAGRGGGGRGGAVASGFVAAQPTAEKVDGIEWTTMSRADAAARSGMALYGIESFIPVRTMVSADASKVRTVYLLNGAEIVLLQERLPKQVQLGSVQPSATGLSSWSSVRGDVVLTLRGAGDNAAMLGTMIRLD